MWVIHEPAQWKLSFVYKLFTFVDLNVKSNIIIFPKWFFFHIGCSLHKRFVFTKGRPWKKVPCNLCVDRMGTHIQPQCHEAWVCSGRMEMRTQAIRLVKNEWISTGVIKPFVTWHEWEVKSPLLPPLSPSTRVITVVGFQYTDWQEQTNNLFYLFQSKSILMRFAFKPYF